MTVYGNFEAIKRIHKSHHGSIWSARTAGTTESADCCIKVIELNPTMLQEGDTAIAQHLLVASALQQAMGNKSEYWAPIYGLGSQGTNAFYVSRFCPRSCQSLIDLKLNLTSSELRTLMLEVVEGLMDLDAAFHRSHGNLKPSNVLIADRAKIRKGGVLLTDPDASNEEVPSLTRTPDSKAIGELIYAMVTHKPHTTARWPLPKSSQWRKLGSSGKQWFALCDDLLNTVSRRGMPTLERIRERIEAIKPTRRQLPRTFVALAFLGCVAAAAYVERKQIPGWIKQANTQVAGLLGGGAKRPIYRASTAPTNTVVAASSTRQSLVAFANNPDVTQPTVLPPMNYLSVDQTPVRPGVTGHPNAPVPPVLTTAAPSGPPNLTSGPAAPIGSSLIPQPTAGQPAVWQPNIGQPSIAAANVPAATGPSTTGPAALVPGIAVGNAQPPVVPVVPSPPIVQTPPVVQAPARSEDDGTKMVQAYPPPEYHSDAARAEFIARREKFVSAYAGFAPATVLSDWMHVMAKVQGLETEYPPLDPQSTAGWPAGLAGVMNARRDTALVHTIDAAFDKKRPQPESFQLTEERVQKAAKAVISARESLAKGDILAAEKSIAAYRDAIKTFPENDADLIELFSPVDKEFSALTEIEASNDRLALIGIADNDGAALAVRVAAWFRLSSASKEPWPADLSALLADDARAERLKTLLTESGGVGTINQITTAEQTRRDEYFSRLKDEPAVLASLRESTDPKYASLLAKAPLWYRYDAALLPLKTLAPARVSDDQKKLYADLAGQVDAPGVQLVRDVLKQSQSPLPQSLAHSGPGSIGGWQLRSGWTHDHCTFVSPAGTDTLEFLRVHVTGDADGIDCYLATTEAPISLLRHLVNGNPNAYSAVKSLNASPVPVKTGMRIWSFNDAAASIDLDDADYRKCFIVSPSDQLPVDFVSPQSAFYLARRVGCRLPTSHEWLAALAMAKESTDPNLKGFATIGYRLRDRQFARLLTNPNRDAKYWPDDNIFLGDLDPASVPHGSSAATWSITELARVSGRNMIDAPGSVAWPLSALTASNGYGFRTVGDTDNYAGVFHDLIGNVAEYTMDSPVVLAERVALGSSLSTADTVHKVNDWFNGEHQKTVAVIGGSALSPPGLDPEKTFALPANGPTVFADVGFRLAFTDPASVPNAQRAVIGQASYLTAP